MDDEPLIRAGLAPRFTWQPQFYAGCVEVVVEDTSSRRFPFWLDVSPLPSKLGRDIFGEMLREVFAFDATLLIGASASVQHFGRDYVNSYDNPLVALARLRRYGPHFLKTVKSLALRAHQQVRLISSARPISAIRQIHPSALLNPRLLAAIAQREFDSGMAATIHLETRTPAETFDTPANRTIKSLVVRFRTAVSKVKADIEANRLGDDATEQMKRRSRRLLLLNEMDANAYAILTDTCFRGVSKTAVSAAGLTQIAALPAYSRAYRLGCKSMRTGVTGETKDDLISISPTYDIYEKWCFVRIYNSLPAALGIELWGNSKDAVANAQLAYRASIGKESDIELLFQANFPAGTASSGKSCFSISRERYPDILIVVKTQGHTRALILDAKYRSKRANVLEAMESAHIYHDSLRLAGSRPELCLLLLPGSPDVPALHETGFWLQNRVGALGEFKIASKGIAECLDLISLWARSHFAFTDSTSLAV